MLTLTDATGRRTGACALRNALYLLPLGLAATWLGLATPPFAYEATIATGTHHTQKPWRLFAAWDNKNKGIRLSALLRSPFCLLPFKFPVALSLLSQAAF
jgi:hypothetical protein